jgi:hypothetical protein
MQAVYISNRPTIFAETLQHIALFMPFIKAIVVCVPDKQIQAFQAITSTIPVQVVAEGAVLSDEEISSFSNLDHQRRNYLLRGRLVRSDKVDAQFIMSDDDARPLKPITLDTFIKDGRYRRYFFYDLASWDSNQTKFDAGQIATYAVLQHERLEHLSYASHMPQIIDKDLFIEAGEFFAEHQKNHPLCEWSTYFNYASEKHPQKFHQPEAYTTLCWPEHPLSWKLFVAPNDFSFENYTPSLYQNNNPFANVLVKRKEQGAEPKEQEMGTQNIQKIIAWREFVISQHHPDQSKSLLKFLSYKTWVNKLLRHRLFS